MSHAHSGAEIVKFPGRISRRIACRRPRRSKNGTPEERAAKATAIVDRPIKRRRSKNGTPEERAAKRAAAMPNGGVPATVAELPAATDVTAPYSLDRANEMVRWLSESYVRDGWSFDAKRAARFLVNVQEFDPENGDCEHFRQIREWVPDHGQSLDWLFDGDMGGTICRLAKFATVPTKAKPKLVVITPDDPPSPGAA
jgi:hypothetical protein